MHFYHKTIGLEHRGSNSHVLGKMLSVISDHSYLTGLLLISWALVHEIIDTNAYLIKKYINVIENKHIELTCFTQYFSMHYFCCMVY